MTMCWYVNNSFLCFSEALGNMNIVENLYLCYKGMARTRSVFRHPIYYKPDHTVVAELSNAEVNGVLMNILVRVKSKTFFCVQLRTDDYESRKRYYVGVSRRYENICVSYIHSAPMPQPLAAYMWPEALQVKDLNLEAIRQALLRADDVNLRIATPPYRVTVRYEDLTAADDGNQDKAAISDASDLPWDLSRCIPNATEAFHENNLPNEEKRTPRKATSPRKRSRNGYTAEGSSVHEVDRRDEREEKGIAWPDEELLKSGPIKSEPIFDPRRAHRLKGAIQLQCSSQHNIVNGESIVLRACIRVSTS